MNPIVVTDNPRLSSSLDSNSIDCNTDGRWQSQLLFSSIIPNLPPPDQVQLSSYTEAWKAYKNQRLTQDVSRTIVYEAVWLEDTFLVACASDGYLYAWQAPPLLLQDDEDTTEIDVQAYKYPVAKIKVSDTALRTMLRISSTEILVGDDDGIRHFTLDQIINHDASIETDESHFLFRPHTPLPGSTAVITKMDLVDQTLFASCHDAFGCYHWDLVTNKLLKAYTAPNSTTLSIIAPNTVVTGGKDGLLRIWDIKQQSLVDTIDMSMIFNESSNNNNNTGNNRSFTSPSKRARPNNKARTSITHCCKAHLDTTDWFCVAGTSNINRAETGWLSTFHTATRSVVATSTETKSTPNQRFNCIRPHSSNTLLAIGNTPVVQHWQPMTLQVVQEYRLFDVLAGYALAVAPDGRLAIGGVGRTIHLYENEANHVFTFTTESAPRNASVTE